MLVVLMLTCGKEGFDLRIGKGLHNLLVRPWQFDALHRNRLYQHRKLLRNLDATPVEQHLDTDNVGLDSSATHRHIDARLLVLAATMTLLDQIGDEPVRDPGATFASQLL